MTLQEGEEFEEPLYIAASGVVIGENEEEDQDLPVAII